MHSNTYFYLFVCLKALYCYSEILLVKQVKSFVTFSFYNKKVENVKSKEMKYLQPYCRVWVLAYVTIVVTTCHTIVT